MKKRSIVVGSFVAITVLATSSLMAFAATGNPIGEKGAMNHQGKGYGQRIMSNGNTNVEASERTKANRYIDFELTEEQKIALHESRTSAIKAAVNELVNKKVFTEEEADAIITEIPEKSKEKPQEKRDGMMQNLTDDQRIALKAEMKIQSENNIKELVEAGNITQEQADQMSKRGYGHKGNRMNCE